MQSRFAERLEIYFLRDQKISGSSFFPKFPSPVVPKILYFFLFYNFGSYRPFVSLFLQELGISADTIGLILFFPPFIVFFTAPIWSSLADKFKCHKQFFLIATSCSGVLIFSLIFLKNHYLVTAIVLFNAVFWSPQIPIMDSSTYKVLGNFKDQYGRNRMAGSIGFAVSAFVVGEVVNHVDTVIVAWINYSFGMVIFFTMISLFYNTTPILSVVSGFQEIKNEDGAVELSENKAEAAKSTIDSSNSNSTNSIIESEDIKDGDQINPDDDHVEDEKNLLNDDYSSNSNDGVILAVDENDKYISEQKLKKEKEELVGVDLDDEELQKEETRKQMEKLPFGKKAALLLSNIKIVMILSTALVVAIGMSVVNSFLSITIKNDFKGPSSLIGVGNVLNVVFEAVFFFFGKQLLNKIGVFRLIIISHAALILRVTSYSFLLHLNMNGWCILPVELLHGVVFSTIWASGSKTISDYSPIGLEATGQSFFSGIYMGLGAGLGALIGGWLYHSYGPTVMFETVAVGVTIGLGAFLLAEFLIAKRSKKLDQIKLQQQEQQMIEEESK
eukprot:gene10322-12667_t